ncbi:MAG: type II secretion system minor pseudopilin GspK [Rhizobiales bacterium]|nr:type II secretion system minor pseudopilin GspK [Rhizobacter sp.]
MRALHLAHRRPRQQRGAALLTAMIIVTLVATLAVAMVWQQWRAVQVEAAERARAQSAWILSGALDFARLILREDMKSDKGQPVTALTEPWATPLAESRLSTFLAADKANADDGPEAFLSGYIVDAQARYNLRNLVNAERPKAQAELEALTRLCEIIGVETGVAARIANGLRDATAVNATASAKLEPRTVAQLVWLGIDTATVQALQPYVVLLDDFSKVNVNTASKEVLMAAMAVDSGSAEQLVQIRQRTPFKSTAEVGKQNAALTADALGAIVVNSSFFEVTGRLRLADHVLTERSLVKREANQQIRVLQRERIASLEQVGS